MLTRHYSLTLRKKRTTSETHMTPSTTSVSLLSLALGCLATTAHAQWVSFTNQTATRLVAPPALTGQDNIEKDFAFADFDQDGDIDLVVMRKFPGSIQSTCTGCGFFRDLILMNENGVLTDRTQIYGTATDASGSQGMMDEVNDRDVEAFDVDNDGWIDLITATTMSDTVSAMLGQPRVYRNLGDDAQGNWRGFRFEDARIPLLVAKNGTTANPRFCDLAVADFNGDGFVDLYFVDYDTPETSGTICIDMNNDGDTSDAGECQQSPAEDAAKDYDNKLLYNWGNTAGGPGPGYFYDTTNTKMTATQLASAFGNMCMAGDFNVDGLQDVLRVNTLTGGQDVAVLTNRTGSSGPGQTWSLKSVYPGLAPYGMNIGDLDNNGRLDFVIADDGQDRYCLNTGSDSTGQPNFSISVIADSQGGWFGNTISIADLNRDGRDDVIVTDIDADLGPFCPSSGRRTQIYKNTGVSSNLLDEDGLILSTADLSNLFDVAVFDINGDQWPDLVTGGCAGLKVFINNPPIALTYAFPSGVPSTILRGQTTDFAVTITANIGGIVANSAQLVSRINGGAWSSSPLIAGSTAGSYTVRLPATTCSGQLDYYLTATSTTTGNPVVNSPAAAPATFYSPDTISGTVVIVDETFEGATTGWTASADAGLTAGGWQVGDPLGSVSSGSQSEPADDHTAAPGVRCFVTQLSTSGQTAGQHDVDGGYAYLTSPAFNNGGQDVQISYWKWYFCSTTTALDPFDVHVSIDNGPWVLLERDVGNTGQWQQKVKLLSDAGQPGQSFRMRLGIADQGTAGVLEGGFDDLRITRTECVTPCPTDIDGDNATGGSDLAMVLSGWGQPGITDLDSSGTTDGSDMAMLLSAWGNCN